MMFLVGLLVGIVVVALGAGIAFAVALALRSKRHFDAANQVVPGRTSSVPASWAGSHDACAVLHRRLVAAMAALRANESFDDDGGLLDVRVELEQQALAIDDRLVAVAALPALARGKPLQEVTAATAAVEQAVVSLAARSVADMRPGVDAALDDLRQRTETLDEIRRALDASDPSVAGAQPPRLPTPEPDAPPTRRDEPGPPMTG